MGASLHNLEESLHRFADILTPEEAEEILAIQEKPLPVGIRVNPLKTIPEEKINNLANRYEWQVEPLSFYPYGWAITKANTPPGTTIEHRLGEYYLQDAASMVPVSLFQITTAHPHILDMAASPGGKTTHLIDRTLDKGFIIANDASQGRIPALRSVLSTWGGINQAVTQFPGEAFGEWYPEKFDLVLLDAPCSMENFRPTLAHPLRKTTPDERIRLQQRQLQLLSSALKALRIGGQLVYATCSLAPEEDEAVVDKLFQAYPNTCSIEVVSRKIQKASPGLTSYQGSDFHPDLANAIRLWPHLTGMSGFFCALIQKISDTPSDKVPAPSREFDLTGLEVLDEDEKALVNNLVFDQYGFNLEEVLEIYQLELLQRYEQFFLVPLKYLEQFPTLPFEHIGMRLGRQVGNRFEPTHEFITRFGRQFTRGKLQINEDLIPIWISGRDIRHPDIERPAKGQYMVITDKSDRLLGLGKLLPKRIRNMLPRGSF